MPDPRSGGYNGAMLDAASLGPFILHEEIGRGGMARVFSAFHQGDGTPVAVKLMLPGLTEEAETAEPRSDSTRAHGGPADVVGEEAEGDLAAAA